MVRPIRVALVHTDTPRAMDRRSVGIWSYDVPEFAVTHFPQKRKPFTLDVVKWAGRFDVIWQEDHRCFGTFVNRGRLPLFYYVVDSTLSTNHLNARLGQAKRADVIAVDWDRLDVFKGLGAEVWRVSHCVNDRLFRDYGEAKTVDVGFHVMVKGPGGARRVGFDAELAEFCRRKGYVYDNRRVGGEAYARAFNREKMTVQLNRNDRTRAHRTFDALGCRTCLLTERLPDVSGEFRWPGFDYVEFTTAQSLFDCIDKLLDNGRWQRIADNGYRMVQGQHTWPVRARQLHEKMTKWLGWT